MITQRWLRLLLVSGNTMSNLRKFLARTSSDGRESRTMHKRDNTTSTKALRKVAKEVPNRNDKTTCLTYEGAWSKSFTASLSAAI
jgi:hypothetical protein